MTEGTIRTEPPTRACAIPGFEASRHVSHSLHGPAAVWQEKNCYADLWIEVVHALGADPHAMLPFVLAIDFEGDQWTFFKPVLSELWSLYGIDVQELTVWRPMAEHALEHLGAGKLLSIEADAYWMPDTAGTDYRTKHTKTTIVLVDIDVHERRLSYFHNAGCHTLAGEDFTQLLRLDAAPDPAYLPLFAELVRIDRRTELAASELRARTTGYLRAHVARRPATNPVRRFARCIECELPLLRERGLDHYHAWAFGTTRQLGAAFELAARMLDWLDEGSTEPRHAEASRAFDLISTTSKVLILKTARAVSSAKPFDAMAACAPMIEAWDSGMAALDASFAAR